MPFILLQLAHNQEVQSKLRVELLEFERITYDDYLSEQKLLLLDAVTKEGYVYSFNLLYCQLTSCKAPLPPRRVTHGANCCSGRCHPPPIPHQDDIRRIRQINSRQERPGNASLFMIGDGL